MTVKLEVEETKGTKRRLRIEVPAASVDMEFERAVQGLTREAELPGFRRGKVPPHVVEKRFPETLKRRVLEALVSTGYGEGIEEAGLVPVGEPEFDLAGQLPERGKPLVFKASIEVLPEIKVEDYNAVPVERKAVRVTDEDVDAALEAKRRQHAEYLPVEGRGVERGDWVVMDIQSTVDREPLERAEGVFARVGSEELPPEIEEALLGARPGEEKEVKVTRKTESGERQVLYRLRVREVKTERLLVVDDEFAKDVGGWNSVEELKQALRKELEEAYARAADDDLRRQVVDEVVRRNPFEVPQVIVGREIEHLHGLATLSLQGSRKPPQREVLRELAERRVRTSLVLEEIARRETIKVEDDEIEKEMEIQRKGGRNPQREDVKARLLSRKTVDFLLSKAEIKQADRRLVMTPEEASAERRARRDERRRRSTIVIP